MENTLFYIYFSVIIYGCLCEIQVYQPGRFNAALGMQTRQSSTYNMYGSERAVDGNTNSKLGAGSCTHTEKNPRTWWVVDLGGIFVFYSVTLTNRQETGNRLRRFSIRGYETLPELSSITDGNLRNDYDYEECHYQYYAVGSGDTKKFNCTKPIVARYVVIYKYDYVYRQGNNRFLQLCEVQVEADCRNGTYGQNCSFDCGKCRGDTFCDKVTGVCSDGCDMGYTGSNCLDDCDNGTYGYNCDNCSGNCLNGPCDKFTEIGHCPLGLCVPGYVYGGNCSEVCSEGTYGADCNFSCPVNCMYDVCNHQNGSCEEGCLSGYTGDLCDTVADTELLTGASPNLPTVIGGTVAAVLFVIAAAVVLILVLVIFVRKKNRNDNDFNQTDAKIEPKNDLEDSINLDEVCAVKTDPKPMVTVKPNVIKVESEEIIENETVNTDDLYVNVGYEAKSETLILCTDFGDYVYNQKCKNQLDPFKAEFQKIPEKVFPTVFASKPELKDKNRYKNILPYDHNRVTLEQIEDNELSTYINASIVQDYNGKDAYIAALGTTKETINDFWRMIWEKDVSLIVMLTGIKENGKIKCVQYWPDTGTGIYDDINVTIENAVIKTDSTIRTFKLEKEQTSKTLTQYHYLAWPDQSVPNNLSGLLHVRDIMKSYKDQEKLPLLIHCSAGAGRTGTMIALDILLDQADAEGQVDVRACVHKLREQRTSMVQTWTQYLFLHEALAEILSVGSTIIPCKCLEDVANDSDILKIQFKVLEILKPHFTDKELEFSQNENSEKNRDPNIVPTDKNRLRISITPTTYINAVYALGNNTDVKYIASQVPQSNTMDEFWKMIYNEKCQYVICLEEDSSNTSWFLKDKSSGRFGQLTVETTDISNDCDSNITNYTVTVTDAMKAEYVNAAAVKVQEDIGQIYANVKLSKTETDVQDGLTVQLFVLHNSEKADDKNIDNGLLYPSSQFVSLYHKVKQYNERQSMTVLCLNGAKYTGLYIALSYLLTMAEKEQQVDVFTTVKYIRKTRPQFIPTLEQYTLLHRILAENCVN